jgi:lambda family phage portal protein
MSVWSRLAKPFRRTAEPALRRSFEAATGRRFGGATFYGPHGPETSAAAPTIRARARHAYANNGLIRNAIGAIVAETVGAGIEANSAHPDPAAREAIDALALDAFAGIDAERRTDLRGITAAMVLAEHVDGEAFAIMEERDGRAVIRQIPAEWVDESHTTELSGGGYIVNGIEFSAFGERVAYHVRPTRPTDLYPSAAERIRVPADDMLHIFRPLGPGQVRGVSALAPILLKLNEYDQASDALLVKLKVSAMHVGFIVDVNGSAGGVYEGATGIGEEGLEPGAMYRLGLGEDIRTAFPESADDAPEFLKIMRREIAAGLGVPTHLLDGDLSNANYSSLRAGLLPFRARVEQYVYHTLIPQFLDPIFRRVVTDAYLAGRLDVPDLAPALKAEWLPPRPMQVDPAKDAEAVRELLALGLTSRRQAVAALGWNVAALDAEIAADRERERALGLTFTGDSNAPTNG